MSTTHLLRKLDVSVVLTSSRRISQGNATLNSVSQALAYISSLRFSTYNGARYTSGPVPYAFAIAYDSAGSLTASSDSTRTQPVASRGVLARIWRIGVDEAGAGQPSGAGGFAESMAVMQLGVLV
jgi:hypothetical protein